MKFCPVRELVMRFSWSDFVGWEKGEPPLSIVHQIRKEIERKRLMNRCLHNLLYARI
jgi:hypothetical protein